MRLGLLPCAVLLCAVPAAGDSALLTPPVIMALTSIDSMPSKTALDDAFGPQAALSSLVSLARDQTVDLGIALRAIRALPAYCPPTPQACGAGTAVHDELVALVDSYQTAPHTPQNLLRLRAAVEALGATRSGELADVTSLLTLLRGNGSRDVRATVVRALDNLCNSAAIAPLSMYYPDEPSLQVKFAITAAVQDLARCAN